MTSQTDPKREPTRQQLREAFSQAANRGDHEAAAKIALYATLTPEAADAFAASLISVAESILMARDDGFRQPDNYYVDRGIDLACEKLSLELSIHYREILQNLNLRWVTLERELSDG